jgi:hypothetical protein
MPTIEGRRLRIAMEAVVVLLAATAFVCALFWRMVTTLDSTLLEPSSDVPGTIGWLYALQHEGGYHLFGTTHHTLTGAPFGWNETNGLNIQWVIPYYPAYLLTKAAGPVGAYNIVLLAGYLFSGAAMYLLVRYLGCARLVAAWAGLVYIVFPWHLMRMPHASLVHLEFLPLLLVALVAAARRPTWNRFGLVAAATLASWLTSGYFGVMAVITTIAFSAGVLLTRGTGLRRVRFFALTTASTLAGALIFGALAQAADVGPETGLDRPVGDVQSWECKCTNFRVPSRWSIVMVTALVPLAALGLQEAATAASRYGERWKAAALASAVAVTAMVVSFLELGFDPTTSRLSTHDEPPEYTALSRTRRGIVAVYPLVPQLAYFFWQSVHHRRLLNTDAFGSPADDAQHALVNPSTPGTAEQLALLGVTAIVTNGDALRWSSAEYRPNPKDWGADIRWSPAHPHVLRRGRSSRSPDPPSSRR